GPDVLEVDEPPGERAGVDDQGATVVVVDAQARVLVLGDPHGANLPGRCLLRRPGERGPPRGGGTARGPRLPWGRALDTAPRRPLDAARRRAHRARPRGRERARRRARLGVADAAVRAVAVAGRAVLGAGRGAA